MEDVRKAMENIASHVLKVARNLNEEEVKKFLEILLSAHEKRHKVMVVGAGRSALVAKSFAMRLMHLGFTVYVMGETITPSVNKRDVIIAVSGSGRTQIVVSVASAAKRMGATIVAITSFPDSPLGRISDLIVRIPGRTKIAREIDYFARQVLGQYEPLAPLGTLFEDSALIFFDGVITALMNILGVSEDEMRDRHANVEYIG